MLEDYDTAYGIKFMSFRYFNAAGASSDGSIGEDHPDESHLIPNLIKKALADEEIIIFGDEYETPDGTNIRDYIHVEDIADVHILGLQSLLSGANSEYFNIGMGRGYSNKEVIQEVKNIVGKEIKVTYGPKRKGDASALYASIDKVKNVLGWSPKYNLEDIVFSAYKWHKNHPNGYSN